MAAPRISVVVPFYNNEAELGDCLGSIAAQTLTDLEVIMVDDGSTDGSTAIAQSFADADPRFRLIRLTHGGSPGRSRNRGVEQATGEFLAFVDGDDMLPSHAYERMLHTLEQSGSDFVSGGVERIGPAGITPSALHSQAVKGRRIGTHISRSPELFYDVSVWNKLFRKSFWDSAQMTIPEGMLWEDLQAMARAHVLARAVDVIPEPIYYWRERGKGALSITQSRTDIANLRDRIAALLAIDSFLRERGSRKLLRQHQRKALANDLWLYVCDLSRTSEDYRAEFVSLAGRYLDQVDRRVLASLPAAHKLAYHLIARRASAELGQFITWQDQQPVRTVPVVRRGGRLRADLPFRDDRALSIPSWVYRPHWRELDPFVRVEEVGWENGNLVISGCAFVPSVDIPKRRNTSKILVLRPRDGGHLGRLRPPLLIPAQSFRHAEATMWSGQDRYSYDWAGFRCEISPRWFRAGGRWLTGDWDCLILVRAHGVWRPARVHTPLRGPAERPEHREVAPGVRMGAWWDRRQLHVAVARTPAVLAAAELTADGLQLDVEADLGAFGEPGDQPARLMLARPKGATTRELPGTVTALTGRRARIRAVVPPDALGMADEDSDGGDSAAGSQARALDGQRPPVVPARDTEWDLYLFLPRPGAAGGERLRVAFPAGLAELRRSQGDRELAVERTKYGNAVIIGRRARPVIDEHSWSGDGRLVLAGTMPAGEGEYEAVLTRRASTDQHVVPLIRDGSRFTVGIDAAGMPAFGRRLPMRDGTWDIAIRRSVAPGADMAQAGQQEGDGWNDPVLPAYEHSRIGEVSGQKVTFGQKTFRFTTSGYDTPIIVVSPALRITEHGRVQRRALRSLYYPVRSRLPLHDSVFFISWKGKQCGDNPLGIAQELRRRGDEREHIWAVLDWSIPVPDGAKGVLIGTEEYYEALARSRYLISNDDMTAAFVKRDGQVYVQTWHGTPLKKIGFDVSEPKFISGAGYLDHLARDVAKWDLLLSPNPFSTSIMRRAFRYQGEISETGYPRNDVLHSPQAERIAAEVRRRLGLPDGKRVVLYAPTWRDDQYYASGRYRFDFRLNLEDAWRHLGDDYVFLVRGHHQMADDVPAGPRPSFAINVTAYPDITELFLVSDVLVTDYSSAMFDFAATGRPMLFFTYDLESYRDRLRGFYFDFEAEAPGPLLATSDEVVEAIADLDAIARRHSGAYAAFAAKFCPLDDGKAAARACDRIFGG